MGMMRTGAWQVTRGSLVWRLTGAAVLVSCTLQLLSSQALAVGGFVFATPPGWLNISPDAPETERRRAPAEVLALANSGTFAFYAVDLETGANIHATVRTMNPPRVTARWIDDLERMVKRDFDARGLTYLMASKEAVKVAGVTAAHIVGDVGGLKGTVRTALYAVPGEGALAFITFSARSDRFEAYRPAVEASLQALQGAREARDGWLFDRESIKALVLTIAAITVIGSLPLLFHSMTRRLAWRILGMGLAMIMTTVVAHLVGRAVRESDVVREAPGSASNSGGLGRPAGRRAGLAARVRRSGEAHCDDAVQFDARA